MGLCTGRGGLDGSHCCVVNGEICEFLVSNQDGRNFACGLMVELGSWDAVHEDPRYQPIQAHWDTVGISSCGDWQPGPGVCCREGE